MRTLKIDADDRPVATPARAPRRRSTAPAPRSTQSEGRWRRLARLGRFGLLGIAALGAAGLWFSGAVERAGVAVGDTVTGLTAASGLTVQEVLLSGRESATPETVLAATGLQRGMPILAVDLEDVRQKVEGLGWVAEAQVERQLPDTIRITIVERAPFARWQMDGRVVLIDRTGHVLQRGDPEGHRNLRRVVGAGAAKHAAALFALIDSEPVLAQRFANAIRVRDRRWDVEFDNGVIAQLPEDDAATAWRRLADLERGKRILARDLTTLDLRQMDRLVVRLTPEAVQARRTPGKNT